MNRQVEVIEKKRSLHVLNWIIDAIRSGQYGEGVRLPTERELSERLSVSRSCVREALSILGALGIVDRRVGNGTYVIISNEQSLAHAISIAQQEGDIRETYELQWILEVGIAEIAARTMIPSRLDGIRFAYEEMEQAVACQDTDTYFAADRNFHLAIAQATQNSLLVHQVRELIRCLNRPLWRGVKQHFIEHRAEYLKQSLQDHKRLLQALQMRDTALARRVMEEHFERIGKEILDGSED